MPATMKAIVTDGPARSAIAAAVLTKRPAPMIAPIPRATSAHGPRVRLRVPSPVEPASASSASIDFVRNREPCTLYPRCSAAESCDCRRIICTRPRGGQIRGGPSQAHASRYSRTRIAGAAVEIRSEISATAEAPASSAWRALPTLIPPIATTGFPFVAAYLTRSRPLGS